MTRRKVIKLFVGLFALSCIGIFAYRKNGYKELRKVLAHYLRPRLDMNSLTGELNQDEMKTIIALAQTLIPEDETPGVDKQFIMDHVTRRTSFINGYLKEYRNAARLLEKKTRRTFSNRKKFYEVSLAERDKILHSFLDTYSFRDYYKERLRYFSLFARESIRFRDFVIRDILFAFYISKKGWSVLGYYSGPGYPKNPRWYTEPV